jgi:pilus assembly protein FimV
MPVQKPSKVASFALKTLTAAMLSGAVLAPISVNAAGLGKLTVLSSLGQPLRAEIELTAVTPEEASELVAKLASPEAFRAANIDFNSALLSLRFEVEARGSRQFIRITSSQPINEPFVDMLLELTWTNGRLVREYTFLLDPADLRTTNSAQVAPSRNTRPTATSTPAPAPAAAAAAPAAASGAAPAAAAPSRAAAPAPAQAAPRAAAAQEGADSYQVKKGDTLGKIAGRLKPADVSLDMMLVALFRANPDAFNGANMNRLKSGTILSVPDAGTVKGTSQGEAHGVVVAHAADFNAYRSKLAGQVAAATPSKEAESQQSQTGKITAQVKERPTAVTESKDQLKLSKAGEASSKPGKTGTVEDKIAKDRQMADASARVKELEKNVNNLEKLMEVKNKAAASAQAKAGAPAAAPAPAPAPAAAAPAASPAVKLSEPTPAAAPAPAPAPAAPAPADAAPATVAPEASAPAEAAPVQPTKPKRSVTPPPAKVEPGLVDMIMENIKLIGAGVAALLGAAALLVVRRRKAAEELSLPNTEAASVLGDPGTTAHSLFAETGGQSVDTSNSVFNSNFAPSASQLDTNEVDPVAEADVYIAYGRDAQAEEILKEALRVHPERHPVRLKLLEIYAGRKDARAFETQASELYSMTKGAGDEWAQAAALGVSIDPDNPLYVSAAQAKAAVGMGAAAAAGAAGAAPFVASESNELNDFAAMFAEPAAPAKAAADGLDLDLSQDAAPAAAASVMDFDLDRDAGALPSLAEESKSSPKAADSNTLDFDLGGLSFDEPAAAAPVVAEAPAPVPAADEVQDLSFDLGLDTPAAKVETVEAAPVPDAMADIGMDFNLDLPTESKPAAPAADPLADLSSMDFSLPAASAPAAAPVEEAPLSAADFALDLPVEPAPAAAAAPAADFDLSGIDLDLGGAAQVAEAPKNEEEMSALHMEMDTKLDLAVAYQEIGDKEGARELLDEVIRGGSDDQVSRASAMRAQLG